MTCSIIPHRLPRIHVAPQGEHSNLNGIFLMNAPHIVMFAPGWVMSIGFLQNHNAYLKLKNKTGIICLTVRVSAENWVSAIIL